MTDPFNPVPYPEAPTSTTPFTAESGSPANLPGLLGVGAFTVGDVNDYGQSLSKDFVNSSITGPAGTMFSGSDIITDITTFFTNMENYLKTLSMETLQVFQMFLPPGVVTAWTDVDSAATNIVSAMGLGNLGANFSNIAKLINYFIILLDVLHLTYELGTSSDAPGTLGTNGKPTWYSAWNGIIGFFNSVTGSSLTDAAPLFSTWTQAGIPNSGVVGLFGPADIGSAVQQFLDSTFQGVTGSATTGNSTTNLFTAFQSFANYLGWVPGGNALTGSIADITQGNNTNLLNRATTKPSFLGLDPSGDATFPFSHLNGATMPTIPITSSLSSIGMIGIPDGGGNKVAINWVGSSTGSITGFYVNLYKMNLSTGALTLLQAGSDIHGSVSSSLTTNYLTLATPVPVAQGEWYAAEFAVTGSGTYSIGGVAHNAPTNSSVFPKQMGIQRNTSGGVTAANISSPTYSTNVPYAVLTGTAGATQHPPQLTAYTTAGAHTYTVPTWANQIDIIVVGAGGSGQACGTQWGEGGHAGTWAHTASVAASAHPSYTATVGTGGAAVSSYGAAGNAGGASTVTASGFTTLTGAGGAGGSANNNLYTGASPGNTTVNSQVYTGGAAEATIGGAGNSPGGGGAGETVTFVNTGVGAPGGIYFYATQ